MKKLYIVTALILCAVSIQAAQLYYQFPDAAKMRTTDRMMIWQNNSGNRNLTGAQFQYEAVGGDSPLVKQALSSYSSANPNTGNSIYRRIFEVKSRAGKILQYITAAGETTIGTPVALAVNSVNPVNGTTNLFNNYSVRFCRPTFGTCSTLTGTQVGYKRMLPEVSVTYNKGLRSLSSTTEQYIVGRTTSFNTASRTGNYVPFVSYSVAPATTYTLRVMRNTIVQHDGEWTSSCGSAMTDMGGYCESTFSTR